MSELTWVFQHGWGFDSSFFEPIKAQLPKNTRTLTLNRGYFGKPCTLVEDFSSCITVAHSFGMHLLPEMVLRGTKRLVIIGGFCQLASRRQVAYLQWLKKTLSKNPQKALRQFYRDCGVQRECCKAQNLPLLVEDLSRISELKIPEPLFSLPEIVLLHGEKDKISSLSQAEALHALLPSSVLCVHPLGDHALPIENPKWCLDAASF